MQSWGDGTIHPSATVGKGATLERNVIVGADVVIGEDTRIMPNVILYPGTRVGRRCQIFPGAVLGGLGDGEEEDVRHAPLILGDENVVREHVVIYGGSKNAPTEIGRGNLFMGCVMVASGCRIGHDVVIGNGSLIGEGVFLGDGCIIGGLSYLIPKTRVGRMAMVGGMSHVTGDVPPFLKISGIPAQSFGLNVVGLRRRGMESDTRMSLKRAYVGVLLSGADPIRAAREARGAAEWPPEAEEFLDFVVGSSGRLVGVSGTSEEVS